MVEKIKVGDVFDTNTSGKIVVVEYVNCNNIIVQFEDGQQRSATSGNIRAGKVHNHAAPPRGRSKLGDVVVGQTYESNNFGKFKVLEFCSVNKILIEFLNTGNKVYVRSDGIRKGSVKDLLAPTREGVGYIGIGKYKPKQSGGFSREYSLWNSMLARAYSRKYKDEFPTYEEVTVCKDWHNFQNFAEWCSTQPYFKEAGYVLDKDIIKRGNKTYCPEYCRFVHNSLNSLMTKCDASRGDTPIGVSWCNTKQRYAAHVNRDGVTVFCGYYFSTTPAFEAYKKAKEKIIKEMADRFKEKIDKDVYEALYNYEVLITD